MKRPVGMDALPDDPALLKPLIADLVRTLQERDEALEQLRHQLARLQRYQFGRRSETVSPDQLPLWPGSSASAEDAGAAPKEGAGAADSSTAGTTKPRNPHGRRRLPEHLPRERVEHDLADEDRHCADCGNELSRIGEEITEQLDYHPASFFVREHVRFKYACRRCAGSVTIADLPSQPIEKGLPGPGLLAHVLVSKYGDHLPLHRLEGIVRRHDVTLTRSTMCDWVAAAGNLLAPLADWMHADALASRVVHTDDTPVAVQEKKGKKRQEKKRLRQGRFWVYLGDEEHPQIVYRYTPSRKRDGPAEHLRGFEGFLQADAYGGYDGIYAGGKVVEVACWAHARRKFFDAKSSDPLRARTALAFVGELYRVEREAAEQELDEEQRSDRRRERAVPILARFREWLDEQALSVLPKSPLGQAVGYTLRQWTALGRYVEHGFLAIDNNAAERAIRPLAVGRKNWMFCGSDNGGERAAVILSLIQTCKRHEIDPFAYLRDVLERLPAHPINCIDQLSPRRWKAARETSLQSSTA